MNDETRKSIHTIGQAACELKMLLREHGGLLYHQGLIDGRALSLHIQVLGTLQKAMANILTEAESANRFTN